MAAVDGEKDGEPTDGTQVDSDIFVPPSHGSDPIMQALKKNPQNVGLHIAAGEFSKALELLRKQLGITNYAPFRQLFVDIHTLAKMKLHTMPHTPPMDYTMRFIEQPIISIT